MKPRARHYLALLRLSLPHLARSLASTGAIIILMAAAGAMLTGCGGGSVDDDPHATIDPPACNASGVCR